jgi:hypothetical protein
MPWNATREVKPRSTVASKQVGRLVITGSLCRHKATSILSEDTVTTQAVVALADTFTRFRIDILHDHSSGQYNFHLDRWHSSTTSLCQIQATREILFITPCFTAECFSLRLADGAASKGYHQFGKTYEILQSVSQFGIWAVLTLLPFAERKMFLDLSNAIGMDCINYIYVVVTYIGLHSHQTSGRVVCQPFITEWEIRENGGNAERERETIFSE